MNIREYRPARPHVCPATAYYLKKQLRLERSEILPIGVIARSKKDSNNEVPCSRPGACPAVNAGISQSIGEKTGVNSALGVAPTKADFVKEAATSDMFEIHQSVGGAAGQRDGENVCGNHDQGPSEDVRGFEIDGFEW